MAFLVKENPAMGGPYTGFKQQHNLREVSMSNLILNCKNEVLTMSSLELVDFINASRKEGEAELRHDHFMAKVPKVLGKEAAPKFRGTYIGKDNTERPCYNLPKREACLMAMSYSYELQAKVFDRMTELEAKQAPAFQIPSTLSGALMLAAQQAEQIEAQQAALALAAPKVAFVQNYVAANTGSKGFREICKLLNVKEPVFREFLKEQGVMYRLGGAWTPAAPHLALGRFEVKTGVNTGTGHAFTRALFTPKGVEWIAGVWARHCVKQACGVTA
jgi:phage antirepressor YoqD-like protein